MLFLKCAAPKSITRIAKDHDKTIQSSFRRTPESRTFWVPAFAGTTVAGEVVVKNMEISITGYVSKQRLSGKAGLVR
jgi:hypothetical protein